ncbi:ABC transporter ATP-binding protein [Microbacterium saperdae]
MMITDTGHAIRATALTKRFPRGTAVDEVSLEVNRGEVYGFVGLNGAGKTTFMRMLVGLARPTSGSFSVLGSSTLSNEILRRVGTMIEGPTFYPGMTGRQNLVLVAKYAGLRRESVEVVLETVELLDRADDVFRTYSLGMKQRLGLAAALLGEPELLILDEPTNGLDPAGISAMRDLIRTQARQGRSVLLSSHLLSEIAQVCDRVAVLHQGRIIAIGTPAEIEAAHGGAPKISITTVDVAAALEVLRNHAHVDGVRATDEGVEVISAHDITSSLTVALVSAGVEVTGIRRDQRSLEEVFLEMTAADERSAS